jgi:hypothetical protein
MIKAGTSRHSSSPRRAARATPIGPPVAAETHRIRVSHMPGVCPKNPMNSAYSTISTTEGAQASRVG